MLSTAHRVLDGVEFYTTSKSGRKVKRWRLNDQRDQDFYQATHINHPCSVWTRESVENYQWLFDHMIALCREYNYRWNKTHACYGKFSASLASPPWNLKAFDFTLPPSAMDKTYILSHDPIENYRNYYAQGKKHLHSWTKREIPKWI